MNKKLKLTLATVLSVGLIGIIMWWCLQKDPSQTGIEHTAGGVPSNGNKATGTNVTAKTPAQLEAERYDAINHGKIVFYGQVVNQNDEPVQGATVYVKVFYNSTVGSGQKRTTMQTDADGKFVVTGYEGRTLDIGLKKDGYDYAGDVGPFHYTSFLAPEARHFPIERSPVRFVMWKRKGAEPAVKVNGFNIELPWDGSETRVDLLKRAVVKEGGDLIIRLSAEKLTREEYRAGKSRWDWDLILESVGGGGFVRAQQRLMSEAPENGYEPSINLGRKITDEIYTGHAQQDLYVFSRGKLYSKVHCNFGGNPAFGLGHLTLRWHTNPSGSRNLEYDPAKDVTKHYLVEPVRKPAILRKSEEAR